MVHMPATSVGGIRDWNLGFPCRRSEFAIRSVKCRERGIRWEIRKVARSVFLKLDTLYVLRSALKNGAVKSIPHSWFALGIKISMILLLNFTAEVQYDLTGR